MNCPSRSRLNLGFLMLLVAQFGVLAAVLDEPVPDRGRERYVALVGGHAADYRVAAATLDSAAPQLSGPGARWLAGRVAAYRRLAGDAERRAAVDWAAICAAEQERFEQHYGALSGDLERLEQLGVQTDATLEQ